MPTAIQRADVQRLMEQNAQIVEVLHAEEYKREHLPGALHIPLKDISQETTATLKRDYPIIVYCYDYQ